MDIVRTLLIGLVIGMANVIPGVSGSTMAVVFNIYDKFVNAITLNIKKLISNRRFVVPLVCGMAGGVLLFSKLITLLYENFPVQTNYFFTGLIVGSLPMLFLFMTKTEKDAKFPLGKTFSVVICATLGLAALLVFSSLEGNVDASSAISAELPEWTFPLALKIFAAGILGAVAMIIPGISGSLLMLIMGVYPIVMKSIPSLFSPGTFFHALILLLPNGIGVLFGLLCGAWLVKTLLKIAPNQTYAVIFGLLVGSAIHLCPGISEISGIPMALGSFFSLLIGALMAYFSSKLSPKED